MAAKALIEIFEFPHDMNIDNRVVAMAVTDKLNSMNRICSVLALSIVLLGSYISSANAADVVTTYKDDNTSKTRASSSVS